MNANKAAAVAAVVAFLVGVGVGQVIAKMDADTATPAVAAEPAESHGDMSGHGGGTVAEGDACEMDCAKDRPALEARLKANPDDAEALIELGACDVSMGDTVTGLDRLSHGTVLAIEPGLLIKAGIAFARVAESEKAVASFEKALIEDPRNADALYQAGLVAFHNLGDNARAAAYWQRYLEVKPDAENAELIRRAVAELSKPGTMAGHPGSGAGH
jgi:thioredoxin-like negative regulator of GroEL